MAQQIQQTDSINKNVASDLDNVHLSKSECTARTRVSRSRSKSQRDMKEEKIRRHRSTSRSKRAPRRRDSANNSRSNSRSRAGIAPTTNKKQERCPQLLTKMRSESDLKSYGKATTRKQRDMQRSKSCKFSSHPGTNMKDLQHSRNFKGQVKADNKNTSPKSKDSKEKLSQSNLKVYKDDIRRSRQRSCNQMRQVRRRHSTDSSDLIHVKLKAMRSEGNLRAFRGRKRDEIISSPRFSVDRVLKNNSGVEKERPSTCTSFKGGDQTGVRRHHSGSSRHHRRPQTRDGILTKTYSEGDLKEYEERGDLSKSSRDGSSRKNKSSDIDFSSSPMKNHCGFLREHRRTSNDFKLAENFKLIKWNSESDLLGKDKNPRAGSAKQRDFEIDNSRSKRNIRALDLEPVASSRHQDCANRNKSSKHNGRKCEAKNQYKVRHQITTVASKDKLLDTSSHHWTPDSDDESEDDLLFDSDNDEFHNSNDDENDSENLSVKLQILNDRLSKIECETKAELESINQEKEKTLQILKDETSRKIRESSEKYIESSSSIDTSEDELLPPDEQEKTEEDEEKSKKRASLILLMKKKMKSEFKEIKDTRKQISNLKGENQKLEKANREYRDEITIMYKKNLKLEENERKLRLSLSNTKESIRLYREEVEVQRKLGECEEKIKYLYKSCYEKVNVMIKQNKSNHSFLLGVIDQFQLPTGSFNMDIMQLALV